MLHCIVRLYVSVFVFGKLNAFQSVAGKRWIKAWVHINHENSCLLPTSQTDNCNVAEKLRSASRHINIAIFSATDCREADGIIGSSNYCL